MASRWLALPLAAALGLTASACKKTDPNVDTAPPSNRATGTTASGAMAAGAKGALEGAPALGGAATPGAGDPTAPDTSFQFTAQHPSPGAVGSEAVARFVIHPGAGYKMNKDYPTKVTLEPPAGVTVAKPVLELADAESFSDKELTFAVKLTAQQQGEFTIPATVKFAVCTDSTCDPKKQKVDLVFKAN